MKSIFKIFPLFLILFFLKLEGQEYDRTWGTYMGPAGTSIGPHFSSMQVNFDDMQNVNIIGQVVTNNNFNAAYYNQFARKLSKIKAFISALFLKLQYIAEVFL